ncbi:GNAT family N-acetyltransferase [Hoyosella altamirensis]|uniref:N-acetyltransferase domain-containing protein n=1 Tax=Hoyosella altamirensis TaxID=616997 RepID=A0A839RT77_9ACTN|nr:GNAT family N-acetyltransferase [Hoyosella altamirensis]MBB3039103.1 hypothetical protein [Hoyosella altamirensis]
MTPTVEHDTTGQRFQLLVDGRGVGFADYQVFDHVRNFNHTVVNPAEQGQGFGCVVIKAALDDTRVNGLRVLPTCSFVRHFIAKNPEYGDLVVHDRS